MTTTTTTKTWTEAALAPLLPVPETQSMGTLEQLERALVKCGKCPEAGIIQICRRSNGFAAICSIVGGCEGRIEETCAKAAGSWNRGAMAKEISG